MSVAIQVQTTAANRQEAELIAARLVDQRLAACVQISGPIQSRYWWQGRCEQSEEWLCTIKTLESRYSDVERCIREIHSYDEPEILAMPIVRGSDGYLRWLAKQVEEHRGS